MNLKDKITEYPNFPKKGILFRDFSPILKDPSSLSYIADELSLQELNQEDFYLQLFWH
jgi:adenine phosphoribosyltransferase